MSEPWTVHHKFFGPISVRWGLWCQLLPVNYFLWFLRHFHHIGVLIIFIEMKDAASFYLNETSVSDQVSSPLHCRLLVITWATSWSLETSAQSRPIGCFCFCFSPSVFSFCDVVNFVSFVCRNSDCTREDRWHFICGENDGTVCVWTAFRVHVPGIYKYMNIWIYKYMNV